MRTITVKTTEQKDPIIFKCFAINGNYGIEIIPAENEDENEIAASFPEAVRCIVTIATLFPGTHEEWNRYINECIIDTLIEAGYSSKYSYMAFLD